MVESNLLVLFSGIKSVTRCIRKYYPDLPLHIVTVDVDDRHKPTHNVDVLTWDYQSLYTPGFFDYVWVSPPCTNYSIAKSTGKRDLELANALVRKALEIIDYFKPRSFWIENPATGLLCQNIKPYTRQTLLDHIPYMDVDYCKYSTEGDQYPYRKRTRIWSNTLKGFEPQTCSSTSPCDRLEGRKHPLNIGNYSRNDPRNKSVPLDIKHRVPLLLIKELWERAQA
jgi:hypothetical protein